MSDYSHTLRPRQLLNGWWDILPVEHADLTVPLTADAPPASGWTEAAYLVPGFFTDPAYPEAWRAGRSAWVRTVFDVPAGTVGRRAILCIEAAIPRALIFVNGQPVAEQGDMFIGDEVDVTAALQPGRNELAVLLTEFKTFPHPVTGEVKLVDVPWGCCIAQRQAGIWQDAWLEWRPEVHITDVTVVTSIRDAAITVTYEVANAGANPFRGRLEPAVLDGSQVALALPPAEVDIAAGARQRVQVSANWPDYRPWFPEDPHLYYLVSDLAGEHGIKDRLTTRFGFREVTIEGHRILLNGRPQRWYGEWCHKAHSHWLRPEYVRQWYQQLRDSNMNYVRMHTFPHPEYYLDIADEMGILVCQESALYGSFEGALDTPNLWPRAAEHVRRMVRRDKNHPSLVIWSVENEMRWALRTMPAAKEELPRLRALFNTLDPTRPAYHEGDSAIWNEAQQDIISRHYGPACHGIGWWDRSKPLHAGEMGRWHYGSPYVALQWAGDEVYADYAPMCRSLAADAARIIELGRANEVSCLFIWNTSGLDNFRPAEARAFEWSEPCSRYAKPLTHRPFESEYAWWDAGSGYRPGPSFDVMQHSQRPLALVVQQERTQFYADRGAPHDVALVNDLPVTVSGAIRVSLEQEGRVVWQAESAPLTVAAGETGRASWLIPLAELTFPAGGERTAAAQIVTRFTCADGSDAITRAVRVTDAAMRTLPLDLPRVGVLGASRITGWLAAHGINATPLSESDALPAPDSAAFPILVVAEEGVQPGTLLNQRLRDYAQRGGKVLVLEQTHSVFPGLELARMSTEMAHLRDPYHPALAGVTAGDLRAFGDDPFGVPSSDSWVTLYPYVKPADEHLIRPLVDSSGGDFGTGGLQWAPVIEAQVGAGTILATQLRLTDRLEVLPVADRLLRNALRYLAALPTETGQPVITQLTGERAPEIPPAEMRASLETGGTVIVSELTPEAASYWSVVTGATLDVFTPEHPVYQLVRMTDHPLLGGISNEDTCWLENWSYRGTRSKEIIAERLVSADCGMSLLENAVESGLDVLYGDEQASEIDRMPAMSAYFDAPRPRVGSGLLALPVGAGQVLICQVRSRPEKPQYRRFMGLLRWNLGARTGTDVLAGEHTPTVGKRSDGYPLTVRAAADLSPAAFAELLELSQRRVEYCSDNMTFRNWPGWTAVPAEDGALPAASLPDATVLTVGLEVHSPGPRKLTETVGGLPNPDLQTALAVRGYGSVALWINAAYHGCRELTTGDGTSGDAARGAAIFTDIDFEAGANLVVLAWTPGDAPGYLGLRFENKDRQPEITFEFV